jgi:ATP-dependent Lhr-like helicase
LQALVESGEIVAGPITADGAGLAEFCDRRNLERIHRQTLALLRKEVEPVSLYAYADFLARWQHLHPTQRLSGSGVLVRLLQQMRGLAAPGLVWERDLLPLRLEAFDAAELEALCHQGDLVWIGSGGKDPRHARVRFLFRGEGNLFLPEETDEPDLSPAAAGVLAFLKSEGACFFADLEEGLGPSTSTGEPLSRSELSAALVELVMSGLVTNDTLQALRSVLAWSADPEAATRKPLSSLEAELTAWRKSTPPRADRPSRTRLLAARRMATRRVEGTAPPRWPGRWSLVHRIGVWGREASYQERIARQARQLLQCYGIVTRESLQAGEAGWDWGALYAEFRMMEMRGEVRRGYFVQGLPGVQFALPEAVERIREWTRPAEGPAASDSSPEEPVLLNACDPANLFGPARDSAAGVSEPADPASQPEEGPVDPARFTRIPANYVVLLRGRPVLVLETGGQRLRSLPDLPPGTLQRALQAAVDHLGTHLRRLTFKEWNGQPVLDSPVAPLLEAVGFRREVLDYVWESLPL